MPQHLTLLLFLLGAVLLGGCAPSISPLYRDYDVEPDAAVSRPMAARPEVSSAQGTGTEADIHARLRAALAEAGWTEADPAAPNVISTETRELSNWGLYRVLVSLDAVPIGSRHVRILFHPVRRYFTGGRSKIPYLSGSLRSELLPELNAALEAHGFESLKTPRKRDEEQTEGT